MSRAQVWLARNGTAAFGTDILAGTSTSSGSSGLMKNDRRACPKIMILVRLFAVPGIIASGRDRYLSPERFWADVNFKKP